MRLAPLSPLCLPETESLLLWPVLPVPRWPKFGMDRLTLQFQRDNSTVIEDSDRLEAMRFLNVNNPIFAR